MITYHKTTVDQLEIFYRQAGTKGKPVLLLLHGFPTSSHMFRLLLPELEDKYHLIAPDYPGFGQSSMPAVTEFSYTFDHLADIMEKFTEKLGLDKYALYLMDYGAPVGFRLATRHPEKVTALIIQNGNAYNEGLKEFWEPLKAYWKDPQDANNIAAVSNLLTSDATIWQYTHGVREVERISPDNWQHDQSLLDRPGNKAIQLALFLSYGSNPARYPEWQAYFRRYQPPTLIVWGEHDYIFPPDGAHPYKKDLPKAELHLLDAGHFALETHSRMIAVLIDRLMDRISC